MSTEQDRRHGDLFMEQPLTRASQVNSFIASNNNRVQAVARLAGIFIGALIIGVIAGLIVVVAIKAGIFIWRL